MKLTIRTTIWIIMILLAVLPSTGSAAPGISITLDDLSKSTQNGHTVNYQVTISNLDGEINETGVCTDACMNKTITSLDVTGIPSGWTYDLNLPTYSIPVGNGNNITAVLHITPSGAAAGTYSHRINLTADSTLFDEYGDPLFTLSGDEAFVDFETILEDTAIPEFPTAALPIISVLGLMYVMTRRCQK